MGSQMGSRYQGSRGLQRMESLLVAGHSLSLGLSNWDLCICCRLLGITISGWAVLRVPDGPMIVDTHSYMLSPLGPALQLVGGSKLSSASSFCIRFALVDLAPPFM